MTGLIAGRTIRRRIVAYTVVLAVTLSLMAFSSNPAVLEFQRGLGFALRPFQLALNGIGDGVADVVAAVTEIDRLRLANEGLTDENAELRAENARLDAVRRENEQLTALLQLRSGLDYATVATRVIGRESSESRKVLTIDRGTNQGLKVGNVVIAAGGALAGRVISAGGDAATVLLINDPGSIVIGQFASTAATGEVVGETGGILIMRNVDATERIQLSDEVVTAGIELQGGIRSPYPKGLIIGVVVDVQRDANDVVQTAYLQPTAELDRLEYLLVITDYDGGLPPPDQQPVVCPTADVTLPEGEAPCYTPTPAPLPTPRSSAPVASPSASPRR